MNQEKLNFMFIMVDQMTAKALPFYGHPVVKTPNLSKLAEEGVVFENAYCNSPLCAPSRFHRIGPNIPW
jgi:choline-sulfatase